MSVLVALQPTAARVTQEAAEALLTPTTQRARVTEESAEALLLPTGQRARVTQEAVEALISGDASFSGSDTGSGADAATLATALTGADTGSGADAGTLATALTGADTGAGADTATAPTVVVSGSDTGSGADAASVTTALTGADTGSGADAGTLEAAYSGSDTGAGADAATAPTVVVSGSDTGAGVDVTAPVRSRVTQAAAEALLTPTTQRARVTEESAEALLLPTTRQARVTQTTIETLVSADFSLSASDTGSGADAATLAVTLSGADTGSGADAATAPVVDVSASDTGSGADAASSTVDQTAADTGSGADEAAVAADYAGTDTGAGADAESLEAALGGSESGAGADAGAAGADSLTGAETATGADTASLSVSLSGADTGTGADAASVDTGSLPDGPFTSILGIELAKGAKIIPGVVGSPITLAPDATVPLQGLAAGTSFAIAELRVAEDVELHGLAEGTAAADEFEPSGFLTVENPDEQATPQARRTPRFRLAGVEISDQIEYRTVEFIASARGQPGTATLRIRNPTQDYVTGTELTCELGGVRLWGGFVTSVKYGYYFTGVEKNRFVVLNGVDYNIFQQKRILYDKETPTKIKLTPFPADTPDDQVIRYYARHHTDLLADGVNVVVGVEHVGTPQQDDEISGAAGWRFGDLLTQLRQQTGAIDYIDPNKRLIHTDVDTPTAPFGISDRPGPGEIGCRDLEIDFGGENLRNDAMIWGVGQGPVTSSTTGEPDYPGDLSLDSWIDRANLNTADGVGLTNVTRRNDGLGPGGRAYLVPTGNFQEYLTISGLIPGSRVRVTVKTNGSGTVGGTGGGTTLLVWSHTEGGWAYDVVVFDAQQLSWVERSGTVQIGTEGSLTISGGYGPAFADLVIEYAPGGSPVTISETSGGVAFARVVDDASIEEHGLWQIGKMIPSVWRQATVEHIAASYVYGSPQSKRGGKDDRVAIRCTVFEPGLRVADKVPFRSEVFDYEDVIPIRELRLTFPTPFDPQFDLILSHEIDDPWSTFETWWPRIDWDAIPIPEFPWPVLPGPPGWIDGGEVVYLIEEPPPHCIDGIATYNWPDGDRTNGLIITMFANRGTIPQGLPIPDHPSGIGAYLIDGSLSTGNQGYRWQNADSIVWQFDDPVYAHGVEIWQGYGVDQSEQHRCGRINVYTSINRDGSGAELVFDSGDAYPPESGGAGPGTIGSFFIDSDPPQVQGTTLARYVRVDCVTPFYRFPGVFNVAGTWVVNEARLFANCVTADPGEPGGDGNVIGGTSGGGGVIQPIDPPEGEDAGFTYYKIAGPWIPGSLMVWVDNLLADPDSYEENLAELWIRFPTPVLNIFIRYFPFFM